METRPATTGAPACARRAARSFEAVDLRPLVPWLGGPWRRLGRHRAAADVVLAVLLTAPLIAALVRIDAAPGLIVVGAAVGVPLAVRRVRPFPAFWCLVVLASPLIGVRVSSAVGPAVLVALYTVAAHEPRRRAFVAALGAEALSVLSAWQAVPSDQSRIASVVFLSGMVTASVFLGTTLRTRRAYLAALEDRAERLEREREQQAQLAVAAERTRIAREMHDVVVHGLSVMIALADGAVAANRAGPEAVTEVMKLVSATGRSSMADMRRLLGVLRDGDAEADLAPQPGLATLDALVDKVRAAGLPVTLTVSGAPRELAPSEQATVYRVVQEALTNAMRHAVDPTGVQVLMTWSETELSIDVVDDGGLPVPVPVGAPAAAGGGGGHGLAGMRERAAVFDGAFSAGPRPGGGWAVHLALPVVP